MIMTAWVLTGVIDSVVKRISNPFQTYYNEIDKEYIRRGIRITRLYLDGALMSLTRVAERVNIEVPTGTAVGWENLENFLKSNENLQRQYVEVGTDKNICHCFIGDMFIHICQTTGVGFLSTVNSLKEELPASVPEFAAKLITEAASRIGDATGQDAVSIVGFQRFHDLYINTDVADYSRYRVTRRIFICDMTNMITEFIGDVKNIGTKDSTILEHMPTGLGKIFATTEPIPKLFWVLEWHWKNNWQMFIITKTKANSCWNYELPVSSLDFMVIKTPSYHLVFVDKERDDESWFYNIRYQRYELTVSQKSPKSRASVFYEQLKHSGASIEDALANALEDPRREWQGSENYKAKDADGSMKSLRDLVAMFKDRTVKEKWTEPEPV